jgi:putative transposase
MSKNQKRYTAEFKFQVALEALKGTKTLSELAGQHQVHPNQISQWKQQLKEGGRELFSRGRSSSARASEGLQAALYEEIGRLKFELDWVKKKLLASVEAKRVMIEEGHEQLSVRRQCALLGLNRASLYYQVATEGAENRVLMRRMDEQYLRTPFYGSRRMTAWLQSQGHPVNRKRVQRLMRLMGLEAIYPRPRSGTEAAQHKIYPYLLREVEIRRPHQVWSTDITYIPMAQGFMYLVAILDWYSRYVMAWRLSNTQDVAFCLEALEAALTLATPQIFNSDQGVQFTSQAFTARLEHAQVAISMDGRGRALDNVFIERLWRALKYEDIYLNDYATVPELEAGLERYFYFYNHERLHQGLGYRTPASVHFAGTQRYQGHLQ